MFGSSSGSNSSSNRHTVIRKLLFYHASILILLLVVPLVVPVIVLLLAHWMHSCFTFRGNWYSENVDIPWESCCSSTIVSVQLSQTVKGIQTLECTNIESASNCEQYYSTRNSSVLNFLCAVIDCFNSQQFLHIQSSMFKLFYTNIQPRTKPSNLVRATVPADPASAVSCERMVLIVLRNRYPKSES